MLTLATLDERILQLEATTGPPQDALDFVVSLNMTGEAFATYGTKRMTVANIAAESSVILAGPDAYQYYQEGLTRTVPLFSYKSLNNLDVQHMVFRNVPFISQPSLHHKILFFGPKGVALIYNIDTD